MQKHSLVVLMALLLGLLLSTQPMAQTTYVLQPEPGLNDGTDDGSAGRGKDAGVYPWLEVYPGYGAIYLTLYNSPCNISPPKINPNPGFLQFSLADLPEDNIISATIDVYAKVYFNGNGWPWPTGTQQISMRQITSDWIETEVSAAIQPTYDAAIIDFHSIPTVGAYPPSVEFEGWLSFDVTHLYQAWAEGSIPNQGVAFVIDTPICTNGDEFLIYTSDFETAELRPKLVVVAEDDVADTDGDGVPDDSDSCAASDLGAYVTVGDCETEVSNEVLEDGCSFNDYILECASNAANYGTFVSCVSHLSNAWKKDSLISGAEKGAITSCAARADIP